MRYFLLSLLLLSLLGGQALACSCAPGLSRSDIIARSDLVVEALVETSTEESKRDAMAPIVANARVLRWVKGTSPILITITSTGDGAACGVALPEGLQTEFALMRTGDGSYRANLCGQLLLHGGLR